MNLVSVSIYGILFSFYALLFSLDSSLLIVLVHLTSRLVYFGFVSTALQSKFFLTQYGPQLGFQKFKTIAQVIMNNDAFTFILLCFMSKDSFGYLTDFHNSSVKLLGLLMIAVGGSIKIWAANLLKDGYYWSDFFYPALESSTCKQGPYRFMANPMYTIGYLPAYGLAVFFCSPLGMIAAFVDQFLILYFNQTTEVPHYRNIMGLRTLQPFPAVQPSLSQ